MDTEELIGHDLILLLLAAPTRWKRAQGRINGITRLEKLLFLVNQECKRKPYIKEPFHFVAYHYGPYSKDIYEAVELLEEARLIDERRQLTDSGLDSAEELLFSDTTTEFSHERQFLLTADGVRVANYLSDKHPRFQKEIGRLKDKYAGLTLENLIYYVYMTYPDYAKRSIIRHRIIRPTT